MIELVQLGNSIVDGILYAVFRVSAPMCVLALQAAIFLRFAAGASEQAHISYSTVNAFFLIAYALPR
jgi:hypothetical protein